MRPSPPTANNRSELLLLFEISRSYVRCRLYLASGSGACHSAIRLLGVDFFRATDTALRCTCGDESMALEGCQKSKILTPEMVSFIERIQPDFSASSGESLRQIEFRMVQFLNGRIMSFPDYKFRSDFSQPYHNMDNHDPAHWESLQHRQHQVGVPRKKSGKSRLQVVSSSGDHEAEDEMSPREAPPLIKQGSSVN